MYGRLKNNEKVPYKTGQRTIDLKKTFSVTGTTISTQDYTFSDIASYNEVVLGVRLASMQLANYTRAYCSEINGLSNYGVSASHSSMTAWVKIDYINNNLFRFSGVHTTGNTAYGFIYGVKYS